LAVWLRMPGVHLTTCLEIEAAEALLSSFRFDVVVTDLSVSQLGGLEGMRLIRFVTGNFHDNTLYVLSGYVDEGVRSLCSVLGVTAVLEKPEGLAQLRNLLLERRTLAAAGNCGGGGGGGGGEPDDAGEVQQVERLEDFLAANTIRSVLQPVVKLREGG